MKQKDMREFFMPLIVLDAGHGGANPGATYNERKESEDVLALTLADRKSTRLNSSHSV